MMEKFYDLLDGSSFACSLLLGLSTAAAIVFGILCIAAGIAAFWSPWWLLAFVLAGMICGVACGLCFYIYEEHC